MLKARDPITARRMDWLAFHLRWLLLSAAAVLVFVRRDPQEVGWLPVALLILLTLYNLGLALLEFFESTPADSLLLGALAADIVLALALYLSTGGPVSPLIWIGLLPALTVALRRGWILALVTVIGFSLAQAGLVLLLEPDNLAEGLAPVALTALLLWPLTAGAGWLARQLRATLLAEARSKQQAVGEQTEVLRAQARAIYEMSGVVSATLNYTKVLDAVLNFGVLAGGAQQAYSAMTSAVLTFEDDLLHVTHAWRLPPSDERVVCPAREGVLGQVIRTGESVVIQDLAQDSEMQQFVAFRACRSLMAVPLRAGYETYGVVLYGHSRADFFDADVTAFLDAVVNQAIIALQNAQLYNKLRQEKERLVEVQEEAQKKLARDLHDGPTQSVAALAMRANFVRRLLERNPSAAGEELFKMEDLARRTTKEIRHMLFTLRPLALESQGLTAALQQLAEKMRETHSQNVIVEAEPGVDDRLEKSQQGVLFYIAEEAVGNARKHAQAAHIWVRLKTQRDVLTMEIQDDGVGFNVGAVDANYEKRGSLGMVNMRERAEMVSGAVKIESAEGRGARISILVPLSEAAATGSRA